MTDAEKVFNQTVQKRKRIARGAQHKRMGGGHIVSLPSDQLTEKEKTMLNGEVTTYKLDKPVKWAVFKTWPGDIRREYILGLQKKYHASSGMIYKMLGISQSVYFKEMQRLNIEGGMKPPKDKTAWEAFLEWEAFIATAEPETEEASEKELYEGAKTILEEDERAVDAERIAGMIRALIGTGAKVTIEVTL
jgi:hypothetical protein